MLVLLAVREERLMALEYQRMIVLRRMLDEQLQACLGNHAGVERFALVHDIGAVETDERLQSQLFQQRAEEVRGPSRRDDRLHAACLQLADRINGVLRHNLLFVDQRTVDIEKHDFVRHKSTLPCAPRVVRRLLCIWILPQYGSLVIIHREAGGSKGPGA
ncbi:hypothetical protein PM3016_7406 [Paenibacillus mucilaginosus 3016]|uniref:Uncharacterized protein n=1 Tax=Paenibacillus mucilaginosus 3016 TaxID=1116391 RepID=H6NGS1_9BACL|nr:hypothetical protein PM3016_7406 [Paenibacillus mucilaginosus 3016]